MAIEPPVEQPVMTDRWTDAVQIAAQVSAGAMPATSVAMAALQRLDVLDAGVRAFVRVWRQDALAAATAVDKRVAAGEHLALAGVPIAVKASEGTSSLQAHRLIAAGCVPLGATAVPGAGTAWRTWGHTTRGPTRNPWRHDRSPGGSSAGSAAAVAAGIVPLATASDGAGSTRIPAAWCGLVGVKPTNGRLPARDRSGMNVAGPLARSVRDATAYLTVVCDPTIGNGSPVRPPLRAVWSADLGFAAVDPAVAAVTRHAAQDLQAAGAVTWVDHDLQLSDPAPAWVGRRGGADMHAATARNDAALADLFDAADVLLTPTTPNAAHGHRGPGARMSVALTWGFNVSGHPALSIPTAQRVDGCPVGLQIVAPHWHEDRLLFLARAAERCWSWPRLEVQPGGRAQS